MTTKRKRYGVTPRPKGTHKSRAGVYVDGKKVKGQYKGAHHIGGKRVREALKKVQKRKKK